MATVDSSKFTLTDSPSLWLPGFVFVTGTVISLFWWYLFSQDIPGYFHLIREVEPYLHWIVLVFGVSLSLLIASLIRVAQLAKQQARSLNQMNEDLKKEINDRIHAEELKQKLEVALLQGQKLQAIGTLAGGIAHDFNNILYAIIGYVEMAREDTAKEAISYQNLGKVLEGAKRGRELIARILAFSRRQHHQSEVINLKQTIEAALSLLRPTIPASVIIHFNAKPDMQILGNQTQLHQIFVNIINNAVDAMDGEGTIHIQMSRVTADDAYLQQFPDIKTQNYCKIDIRDKGRGMNQQTMERMFEPFFTTKEVGKGTGLGLSIVHTLVKEHDGEITVASQLGQGTTITILLPEYTT